MEKFIHLDFCDSTQDVIKEQLSLGHSGEMTVSCEHQIKGRGRGLNTWLDGAGTICFSMTIFPHHQTSLTALEISVLICNFFESKGKNIRLKWTNDLITPNRKKCGGILVQNFQDQYFVGVGINIFSPSPEFGGIFSALFTFDKKEWVTELSNFIRTNRFTSSEKLINDWSNKCIHLNEVVTINESDQKIKGIFKGLGNFGEALIETENGTLKLFNGSLHLEN